MLEGRYSHVGSIDFSRPANEINELTIASYKKIINK